MLAQHSTEPVVIACDLNAIPVGKRAQHAADATAIFAAVQAVRELADGYGFQLPGETAMLAKLVDFISYERLCCPFFAFGIDVEPNGGTIWLRLNGGEGVKEFVAAEIGSLLSESVARAAGFRQAAS